VQVGGGGRSFVKLIAVTVLPDPLSPTIAKDSFSRREKLIDFTASVSTPREQNLIFKFRTSSKFIVLLFGDFARHT
jgi:hypothetical protein